MKPSIHRARIVVLASGNGTNLQALIDGCARDAINGEIVGVLSDRDGAFALERAQRETIPTRVVAFAPFRGQEKARESFDAALANAVSEFAPDLVVLAGFMRILSDSFLGRFPMRIINLHPALPGQFAGKNAIERAWQAAQAGEISETGVMVHIVTKEMDGGPVLGTAKVSIDGHDSLLSLTEAIHAAEHFLLVQVVGEQCANPSAPLKTQ